MIAPHNAVACSDEELVRLLRMVRLGQLFELMDWVASGLPTLCPSSEKIRHRNSPIHVAAESGNHSMVKFLWEQALQRPWEIESLLPRMVWHECVQTWAIAKYLIEQGFSLRGVNARPIFASHDDELIHLALKNGLCVREPEGFADALSATAHSKHLLRLFRELKGTYPDFEIEGLLALRQAVEKENLRAVALLTWAGVDPLRKIPSDPYRPRKTAEGDSTEDDDAELGSALDAIRLNERTRNLLKALKVAADDHVWLRFFDEACWLHPELIPAVYHWVRDSDGILLAHPTRAAKLATTALKHLSGWFTSSRSDQVRQFETCEYLAFLGIPQLMTEDDYEVRRIRQSFGGTLDTRALVRLLWVIHWKGDEAQRARLKEVIRTPKMQSIVREHDPFLLRDLCLGPKSLQKVKVTKRDRPWHADTYSPPQPFELPPKINASLNQSTLPSYTAYQSPPPRKAYWNKWSHFHRQA